MEKLWNKEYIKVMSVNFLMYFAFYLLTPLLPIYLSERFHAGNDTIGLVLSGYTIASLIVRPFSGFIVDSFNRKRVLMVTMSLFFLLFAGYLAAGTLLMFAIYRTLHGAPFGAVTVANSTCAIDVLPSSRRNEGLGFYGLSNNLSMAIAPTAGVYIYKVCGDFSALFWLSLLTAGIALLMASLVKLPQKEIVPNKEAISLDRFFLTRAWLLAVNIMFFSFCFGVLSNYIAIYSHEALGISSGTGIFFTLLSIGLFASRLQGAKALREGKLTQNAAEGICISLVGYTLFVAIPCPFTYYLSALMIGLGNGHMYPAFLNMFINVARNNQRGTANSSILTAWDLGLGFGILLGGVVSEHFGYSAAFWMTAGINALGVVLYFFFTRSFFLKRQIR